MAFCIMRTRKLKTDGNVGASLAHAWRDRETPNADPARTPSNAHLFAKSREDALSRYRKLLPEKVRKNGVRCIEYLVTYSPDGLTDPKTKAAYFQAALDWLKAKHGKNLFYAGIHLDEKTPHLYAYAVPIDERGKLNCRSFLGGREKLSALQDEFHQAVGKVAGLERGLKGSKARHQDVSRYYSKAKALDEAIAPPKRERRESDEEYAERYRDQVSPLVAAAAEAEQLRARNVQLEDFARKAKDGFKTSTSLTEGLAPDQVEAVKRLAAELRRKPSERSRDQGRGKER